MSLELKKPFDGASVKLAYQFAGANEWCDDLFERFIPVWKSRDAWVECSFLEAQEKDRLLAIYKEECVQLLSYVDDKYGGCDAIYQRMEDDIHERFAQHKVSTKNLLATWRLGVKGKYPECDMPIAQIDALSTGLIHSYGYALNYLECVLKLREESQPALRNE